MNNQHDTMKDILERADVDAFRELNAKAFPQYPQPPNRESAEISLHYARTQTPVLALKLRAYSHRWLLERNYPSGLPDNLRPSAERLYPTKVDAVGHAIMTESRLIKSAAPLLDRAMGDAVEELVADGVKLADPEKTPLIVGRMVEAKEREMNALFGRRCGQGID